MASATFGGKVVLASERSIGSKANQRRRSINRHTDKANKQPASGGGGFLYDGAAAGIPEGKESEQQVLSIGELIREPVSRLWIVTGERQLESERKLAEISGRNSA